MQKIFLTYMNQSECPSYSLVGTVNDEFHDIDASQKFFDIPLYTDPDSEDIVLNSINFEVKADMHDDKFCAIPVYFWRPWTRSYNNHKHKIVSVDLNHYIKEPTITKPPNVLYTLHRAVNIMSKYAVFHASFVEESWKIIRPNLSEFGLFDYHKAEELIKAGYRITKEALE